MSNQIVTVKQVRLTNVAIVRLKREGKRFEIACYKNKVLNWRNGVETNIDEVLQIDRVFTNVGKGIAAKSAVLQQIFGTSNTEEVCREILARGEMQVSDKEREAQFENLFKDIAAIVTDKCVNPQTGRPYPMTSIEQAMHDTIHYAVVPSRSAKQQALEVIRQLKKHIPLERAKMLVQISVPGNDTAQADAIRATLIHLGATIDKDALAQQQQQQQQQQQDGSGKILIVVGGGGFIDAFVDPGHFRELDTFVQSLEGGVMEVKDTSVQIQREGDLEQEGVVTSAQPIIPIVAAAAAATVKPSAKANSPKQATTGVVAVEAGDGGGGKKKKKKKRRANQQQMQQREQANKILEERAETRRIASGKAVGLQDVLNKDVHGMAVGSETPQPPSTNSSAALGLAQQLAAANLRGDNTDKIEAAIAEAAAKSASVEWMTGSSSMRDVNTLVGLKCLTCVCAFGDDRKLQMEHYRSDLHRLNLKLKSKALPPVTVEEFEMMGPEERDAIMLDYKIKD